MGTLHIFCSLHLERGGMLENSGLGPGTMPTAQVYPPTITQLPVLQWLLLPSLGPKGLGLSPSRYTGCSP